MSTQNVAALEGWFTLDPETPSLIGTQCTECSTYYFPKVEHFCKNPNCQSEAFTEVELSREGEIWSYTTAAYQPPAPYVAKEPFEPFTIAAVKLEKEQMIVLGQMVSGVSPEDIKVGDKVELNLDSLHEDQDDNGNTVNKMIWKWKPCQ